MSSKQATVDEVLSAIRHAGQVSARKMFGEYSIYCDEKLVALVADDQLFVKKTAAGSEYLGDWPEAPPYPGAKLCFLIDPQKWSEHTWLSELIRVSASDLTKPAKKKRPGKRK